jgi:hypothetical protein
MATPFHRNQICLYRESVSFWRPRQTRIPAPTQILISKMLRQLAHLLHATTGSNGRSSTLFLLNERKCIRNEAFAMCQDDRVWGFLIHDQFTVGDELSSLGSR